jgi:hypothetical protein
MRKPPFAKTNPVGLAKEICEGKFTPLEGCSCPTGDAVAAKAAVGGKGCPGLHICKNKYSKLMGDAVAACLVVDSEHRTVRVF